MQNHSPGHQSPPSLSRGIPVKAWLGPWKIQESKSSEQPRAVQWQLFRRTVDNICEGGPVRRRWG